MRRASLTLALMGLLVATACVALLSWVLVEPGRWLPDKDSRREVALLQREVNDLEHRIQLLTERIEEQRPYAVAVDGLCHAFRTITGLNQNTDEYALVVARSLVGAIVQSCDYGKVTPGAGLRP